MIGVLVVSHAALGDALVATASHMLGRTPARLAALGIAADADPQQGRERIARAIAEVDGGSGVLILVDMFGATPANLVSEQLQPGRIEAIGGANLPMLMRVLGHRDLPLAELLARSLAGGREGILDIGSDPCRARA